MYSKITKFKLAIVLLCSLSLQNYSSDKLDETSAPKEPTEEENNMTPNLFPNLIANEKEWNKAKEELNNNNEALKAYNSWIESKVGRAMASTPYATYKLNKQEQEKVQENAKLINILAVSWFFMDKDTDKARAKLKKVTQLIYKWASSNIATSHTPVEATIMPIYESYSLIRTYIRTSDREKIDKWIQKRVDYFKRLNLGSINTLGNWNTIRISFLFQFALILEDEILYEYAIEKFESHIEKNLLTDGKSYDLIKRDAFAYHAYNLQFYARILKSVGMFKGKQEALKLYQQKNSSGGSIEKCVQYWEPFLIDPQNNIHLEFVNTSFRGDKTRGDYNRPYNPNGSIYVLDELRYIEPECSRYIQSINLGTRYNRNFKYWINSVITELFYGASAQTIVYYEDFESNTGSRGFNREIVSAGGHNSEREIIKKIADIPDLEDSNNLFDPTNRHANRIPNGGTRSQFAISTKAMDNNTNYEVDAYSVFTTLDLTSANTLISASDTHKYATFWTQRRYGEGDIATVTMVVTTEYTGNPSTTSWTVLPLYSGKLGDTSDGRKYVQGTVDLTSYANGQGGTTVTLALRYQGSSSAYSNSNRNGIFYFSDLQFIANTGTLSVEDDILNESLSMYPNPVNYVLNIDNPDGIIIKNISLINITGKTVYSGGNTTTINVSNFAKGVYILRITSAQGIISKKIIVN